MPNVHHIQLLCEIDPERESIQGEMSVGQGETLPFSGWTEFASALMSLTGDSRNQAVSGPVDEAPGEILRTPRK